MSSPAPPRRYKPVRLKNPLGYRYVVCCSTYTEIALVGAVSQSDRRLQQQQQQRKKLAEGMERINREEVFDFTRARAQLVTRNSRSFALRLLQC